MLNMTTEYVEHIFGVARASYARARVREFQSLGRNRVFLSIHVFEEIGSFIIIHALPERVA